MYLIFSKKVVNLSIWQCFHKVCFRLLIVILISVPLPVWISFHTENLKALLAISISFLLLFLFSSIFFGLDKKEMAMFLRYVRSHPKQKKNYIGAKSKFEKI
jgi:hypothetical protein